MTHVAVKETSPKDKSAIEPRACPISGQTDGNMGTPKEVESSSFADIG